MVPASTVESGSSELSAQTVGPAPSPRRPYHFRVVGGGEGVYRDPGLGGPGRNSDRGHVSHMGRHVDLLGTSITLTTSGLCLYPVGWRARSW